MPITVTSKTFADEFNTGTTTDFTNGNVGDEWVATINVQFENKIDANFSRDYFYWFSFKYI